MNKKQVVYEQSASESESARENQEKLNSLLNKNQSIIFEAKAVFPFDLFPDKLSVDVTRVTVTHNYILSSNVFPIPIETVNAVEAHFGILFASLRIEIQGFNQNPEIINFLWNSDARRAKRFILALIQCRIKGIDLSNLDSEKLKVTLEKIGSSII